MTREIITLFDPASTYMQRESNMTQRQLVLFAKRQGWRTRRVYGRTWICEQDYNAWRDARPSTETMSESDEHGPNWHWSDGWEGMGLTGFGLCR